MTNFILPLMVLLVGSVSFADTVANSNGQSKENKNFESESEFEFPDFLKVIKAISPDDGRVRIEYETLGGFNNDKNNRRSFNVSMETYLFGLHESSDTSAGVVPVEFRLAFNAEDLSDMSLRDLRVGVIRYLSENSPFTVQVASYVLKTYPQMYGRFHGAEIVGMTLKSAAAMNESGTVELVVKGEFGLQIGATTRTADTMKLAVENSGYSNRGVEYVPTTLRLPVSGSVGVRIAKKLLIDAYGGIDLNGNWAGENRYASAKRSPDGIGGELDVAASSHMAHLYGGGGVRFQWRGFVVSGVLQKDKYYNTFKYERVDDTLTANYYSDGAYRDYTRTNNSTHKGSQGNSDSGYSGMISIGYDW